jgi:hypothetical protein
LFEEEFDHDETGRLQAGYLKLVPAVTFGLRAAALAGLVISAGVAAAGLGGFFDSPASVLLDGPGSSCCSN